MKNTGKRGFLLTVIAMGVLIIALPLTADAGSQRTGAANANHESKIPPRMTKHHRKLGPKVQKKVGKHPTDPVVIDPAMQTGSARIHTGRGGATREGEVFPDLHRPETDSIKR